MQPFDQTQKDRQKGRRDFRDPVKHYVRIHGWLPIFRRRSEATGTVRYLTLCGKEAIDVRYFAQRGVLVRNAERNDYPTLTFIESNQEDYAIIAECLGRVRLGVHAKLEEVLLDNGHASHDDLVASFPHDIINLDFCGDIVPNGDHPHSATIKCISRVVELQANSGSEEWHLFLTFRAQRTRTNDEANSQLQGNLLGNLERPELREAYGDRARPTDLVNSNYPEFLRVGIAKVLTHAARNRGYRLAVESSWVYGRPSPDMPSYHIVKLVARFERLQAAQDLPNPHLEQETYLRSVRNLLESRAVDVDAQLNQAAHERIKAELREIEAELGNLGVVTA